MKHSWKLAFHLLRTKRIFLTLFLGPVLFANFILLLQMIVLREASTVFTVRDISELDRSFLEALPDNPGWKFVYGASPPFSSFQSCSSSEDCAEEGEFYVTFDDSEISPEFLEELKQNYFGLVPGFTADSPAPIALDVGKESSLRSLATNVAGLVLAELSFTDREAFARAQETHKRSILRKERLGEAFLAPTGGRGPIESDKLIPIAISVFHLVAVLILLSKLLLWSSSNTLNYFEGHGVSLSLASMLGTRRFLGAIQVLSGLKALIISLTFLPGALAGVVIFSFAWSGFAYLEFDQFKSALMIANVCLSAMLLILLPQVGTLLLPGGFMNLVAKYFGSLTAMLGFLFVLYVGVYRIEWYQYLAEPFAALPLLSFGGSLTYLAFDCSLGSLAFNFMFSVLLLIVLLRSRERLFKKRLLALGS